MKNINVTISDKIINVKSTNNTISATVGGGTSITVKSKLSNSQIENLVEDVKTGDQIKDDDSDTYVTVEKNTDEDIVRFYIKGTEVANMQEDKFNLIQNLLTNAQISGGEF